MGKSEIVEIDIDLNLDIEEEIRTASQEISKETIEAIDKATSEQDQKIKLKQEKRKKAEERQKEANEALDQCYILLKGGTKHNPIIGSDLEKIYGGPLSGLILKLKKYIPEKISKKKYMGKTAYYLTDPAS